MESLTLELAQLIYANSVIYGQGIFCNELQQRKTSG
jgi:hypothetical protein